jgi:hypothetical protein
MQSLEQMLHEKNGAGDFMAHQTLDFSGRNALKLAYMQA